MQHNFIETLEATSIYKQGNGSLLNVNAFFWSQNYRKEQGKKKTKQKNNNSQGLDQWQVYFLNTKKIKKLKKNITYEIVQVYRKIETQGICKSLTYSLACV